MDLDYHYRLVLNKLKQSIDRDGLTIQQADRSKIETTIISIVRESPLQFKLFFWNPIHLYTLKQIVSFEWNGRVQ